MWVAGVVQCGLNAMLQEHNKPAQIHAPAGSNAHRGCTGNYFPAAMAHLTLMEEAYLRVIQNLTDAVIGALDLKIYIKRM